MMSNATAGAGRLRRRLPVGRHQRVQIVLDGHRRQASQQNAQVRERLLPVPLARDENRAKDGGALAGVRSGCPMKSQFLCRSPRAGSRFRRCCPDASVHASDALSGVFGGAAGNRMSRPSPPEMAIGCGKRGTSRNRIGCHRWPCDSSRVHHLSRCERCRAEARRAKAGISVGRDRWARRSAIGEGGYFAQTGRALGRVPRKVVRADLSSEGRAKEEARRAKAGISAAGTVGRDRRARRISKLTTTVAAKAAAPTRPPTCPPKPRRRRKAGRRRKSAQWTQGVSSARVPRREPGMPF